MSDQSKSVIPDEWRIAADEAAKVLSVARAIERRQYPEGDAPAGLVPALALAVAINRAARMIPDGNLHSIAGAIDELRDPMLYERVAGIENELHKFAGMAGDAFAALTDFARMKARGDGR